MFKLPWETIRDLQLQLDEDKRLYNLRFLEQGNRIAALERQLKQIESRMDFDERRERRA